MSKPLQIKQIEVTKIVPYWRNPRKNEAAVAAVKASIERFGFTQPIILDAELCIIAGHTRYMAAKQIGLTKIPCVISDMPADLAKEYRVIDNQTSEAADWDMDKLMAELREWKDPAALQPMMPAFNIEEFLKSTVTPPPPMTDAEIQQRGQQLQQNAANIGSATRNLVDMTCPHCAGMFQVDRDEVAKRSFYVPVAPKPESAA